MELRDKIARRASKAGIGLSDTTVSELAAYFDLLRKWNRKVALTSLPVENCGDEAVDRLLIEPAAAVKYFPEDTLALLDVGSGGGSPAIPIKLLMPEVSLRMVESKMRKAAFLREAIRVLELDRTEVDAVRVEELLARPRLHEDADAVTLRAVRLDRRLVLSVQALLRPGGALCVFTTQRLPLPPLTGSEIDKVGHYPLISSSGSHLAVFKRGGLPG